jgi:hypothetical protein
VVPHTERETVDESTGKVLAWLKADRLSSS